MHKERAVQRHLDIEDDRLFLEADTYDHILAVDALAASMAADMEELDTDSSTGDFDDEIDDLFEEEDDDFDADEEEGDDDERRKLWWGNRPRYFYIRNVGTGKYLDVAGGYCHNGNNIHSWQFTGSRAQQFYWHKCNGKTYLINVGCNKVVELANASCVDGTNIQLWNYDSQYRSSQQELKHDGHRIVNPTCQTALEVDYYGCSWCGNGKNVQSSWYHPLTLMYEPSEHWEVQYI